MRNNFFSWLILSALGIGNAGVQAYAYDEDLIKLELADPFAGGRGTVFSTTHDAFSLPNKNIGKKHRIDFVVGNALFKENWIPSPSSVVSRQGLGPLLNAQSCSSCHFKDGRAAPPATGEEVPVGLLLRLSLPGKDPKTGNVIPVPHYGDQLQHKAIMGVRSEASFYVDYEAEPQVEIFADGTHVPLVKPKLRFADHKFGEFPKNMLISPRIGPHLIGLGLLEAIKEEDILRHADPDDLNGDGISGRPNLVWDEAARKKTLGRFGWKANQPNLQQQNAAAFAGDMGITTSLFAQQNCTALDKECRAAHAIKEHEIDDEKLARLTAYTKTLAVPAKRLTSDAAVLSGAKSFHKIGCAQCHVSSYTTGTDPEFPENSGQKIYPYTDLLLHDMGEGLADHRPDFEADGREWRTPPLWGIGLVKTINGHTRFLHDGRARSLEEAILWHGGEGERAKQNYKNLGSRARAELIKFLESI